MAFLNETGLRHLWTRIMEKLGGKAELEHKHPSEDLELITPEQIDTMCNSYISDANEVTF